MASTYARLNRMTRAPENSLEPKPRIQIFGAETRWFEGHRGSSNFSQILSMARRGRATSVKFQPGRAHDLEPARAFLGQERGKILRRAAERLAAELAERKLHVVGRKRRVYGPVDAGRDLCGQAGRPRDA